MNRTVIPHTPPVREAVGLFHSVNKIHDCIDDLQSRGFDRNDFTMLARPYIFQPGSEGLLHNMQALEDNPTLQRGPVVEPESLGDAEGALIGVPIYIATLIGAGISATFGASTAMLITFAAIAGIFGGIMGLAMAWMLKRRQSRYYDAQLDHGGIPLWIHTKDGRHERQAIKALIDNHADDVHLHDMHDLPYQVSDGRTTTFRILH